MEEVMTLAPPNHMYKGYDFERSLNTIDVNNKLFCTFVNEEQITERINEISRSYNIMYNKMFVLFIKSTGEYVITYNVDQGNVSNIPENTILVHRKKIPIPYILLMLLIR